MEEKKLKSPSDILDALESINIQRGFIMNELNEKKQHVHLLESRLKELEKEGARIYEQVKNPIKAPRQDKKEEALT